MRQRICRPQPQIKEAGRRSLPRRRYAALTLLDYDKTRFRHIFWQIFIEFSRCKALFSSVKVQ
jgi:hypothetical protein